ncbi:ankyrin repeat-containing domain protein [Podospora fimiseda]|uniref:Ankyrin repeat-containing domain protein n=1 Tax=Podospora fimiseda TaxID=252190 RepID=A0AAN7BLX3_9PEZI|nr:ankyrin repeat-containing domain protein [Podospora fimiseda]
MDRMFLTLRFQFKHAVCFLACVAVVAANNRDDFANNLLTDLAPILAFFGEKVTMQFLTTFEIFLRYGADIEIQDHDGQTALHFAAILGQQDTIALLVEAGANVDTVDSSGCSALLCDMYKGHSPVVGSLFEQTNLNCRDENGRTLFHLGAIAEDSRERVVKFLLEKKVSMSIDDRDRQGHTPLHLAAKGGYEAAVRLLLESGAKLDLMDYTVKKATPLYLAIEAKQESVARVIISKDVETSKDLLHMACRGGNVAVVKMLIECGADIEVCGEAGMSPLHIAAGVALHVGTSRMLLRMGADVQAQDDRGQTPLTVCIAMGCNVAGDYNRLLEDCQNMVRLLLEDGATASTTSDQISSPLHMAAGCGQTGILELLLNWGADIETRDKNGATALHEAASRGSFESMKLLLKKKCNIEARDMKGQTPLALAAKRTHNYQLVIVQYLYDLGANIESRDNDLSTPLHMDAADGLPEVVEFLLEKGADRNMRDHEGRTPLMRALGPKDPIMSWGSLLHVLEDRVGQERHFVIAKLLGG